MSEEGNLQDQIDVFEQLSKEEQEWLGLVCVSMGKNMPRHVAKSLVKKKLIAKVPFLGDYDVCSYWIHYSWCVWCSRKEKPDGPDEDKERS